MARRAGLEAVSIPGYAKGTDYKDEVGFQKPNHIWNAVKVDGRWQPLDVTWGAGFVKNQWFHRVFQEQYFLTPPAYLVLTHLPCDPRWQLLPVPLTLRQFESLPRADLELFSMGITHHALWATMRKDRCRGFVKVNAHAHHGSVKILAAPLADKLTPGRDYYFLVEAPQAAQMALLHNKQSYYLRRQGTRFEGTIRPVPGELKLSMQRLIQDRTLQTVLTYDVSK
jgi:hypothetical protein